LSLQEAGGNIIIITGKLKAFEEKLQLWIKKVERLKIWLLTKRHFVSTNKNKIG
jgi:hypothetical protein